MFPYPIDFNVIGWDWTETAAGPRADQLMYHDPKPQIGPSRWEMVKRWKQYIFTAFQSHHLIVIGYKMYVGEGKEGYLEFLARGGTYYGAPEDYGIPEEPIE